MCIWYEASKKLRKHFSFYLSTETKSDLQHGTRSCSCMNVLWSFPRSAPEKNFPSNFFPSWNVGADNVFFFGKMRKTLRFPKISMVWANSYRAHIWKRKTKQFFGKFFPAVDKRVLRLALETKKTVKCFCIWELQLKKLISEVAKNFCGKKCCFW